MIALIGKVTAKGQTTIPREVRAALRVEPGDLLLWESDGAVVRWKLFTLDHRLVRGVLGHLGEADAAEVTSALTRLLGCDSATPPSPA